MKPEDKMNKKQKGCLSCLFLLLVLLLIAVVVMFINATLGTNFDPLGVVQGILIGLCVGSLLILVLAGIAFWMAPKIFK